jgi:hypothetical protein
MADGREVQSEIPHVGGSGILATLLLAVCLRRAARKDKTR